MSIYAKRSSRVDALNLLTRDLMAQKKFGDAQQLLDETLIPGCVKLLGEFIAYAQRQKGVVFMRKDETAKWALSTDNVPYES